MEQGDFNGAALVLETFLKQRPGNPEGSFALGVCYAQTGELARAEPLLRSFLSHSPADAEARTILGIVLLGSGQRREARVELESALRTQPGQFEATKALAHIESGDFNLEAVRRLLAPFEISPSFDTEARMMLAAALAAGGEEQKALRLMERTLSEDPRSPAEAYALATSVYLRRQDFKRALDVCERGIRLYPNSDRLERLYLSMQATQEFEDRVNKRLHGLRDADVLELVALGRILTDALYGRDRNLQETGRRLLERAVLLAPKDASVHYNLGRCLRVLNRWGAAIASFERALSLTQDDSLRALVFRQIGLAEEGRSRPAQAGAAYQAALEASRRAHSPMPEPPFALYQFLRTQGDQERANAVLDEILRLDPTFLPARAWLARKLADEEKTDAAIREAELVLRNASAQREDPANEQLLRQAHLLLFQLYSSVGQEAKASEHRQWLEAPEAKTAPRPPAAPASREKPQ